MTLGELLALARKEKPETGTVAGECMVCGQHTDYGFRGKDTVSDNFSGWNRFLAGDCVCPECRYLFHDQTFRKKSWVASVSEGFRTFSGADDREARLQTILNPPEPPFFVYVARAGQRQSWLCCLHRVATSRDRYFLAHEDYDVPVLVNRKIAAEYAELVRRAVDLKITKTELRSGHFGPSTWKRALEGGYDRLLKAIGERRGDILWEVMVHVA